MDSRNNNSKVDKYTKELLRIYRNRQSKLKISQEETSDIEVNKNINDIEEKELNLNDDISYTNAKEVSAVKHETLEKKFNLNTEYETANREYNESPVPWLLRNEIYDEPENIKAVSVYKTEDDPMDENDDEENLGDFYDINTSNGFIKVKAYSGRETIPIMGVRIIISKVIDGEKIVFHDVLTDESGIIGPMSLPAPNIDKSMHPGSSRPYETYILEAVKKGYRTILNEELPVFPGVISLQPIQMHPLGIGEEPSTEINIEQEPDL